jgi:type I restriction enzyme S subunit
LLDAATARVTELTACYEQARTHANNLFTSSLCEMFDDINANDGTRLGEICIDIVDCEHKTVPVDESGVAWAVGTRAMSGGQIDFSKAKPISSSTYAEWTRRMVPKFGDLILAREAPVGPVVQVPETPKVALGQRTVLIRPDTNVVVTPYLHYLLLSEPIQQSMHFKSEGSVVSHLNVKDVRLLSLPMLPPVDEQKRIVARLDLMKEKTSEMVAAYDVKLTAAKNLRQSILEAAFAGDL